MELQVQGKEPVALFLIVFQIFDSSFSPASYYLIFQASGTMNLLLRSPDNNNVLIWHLLNIYVFGHLFAKAL